jgi:hypothetical protein
MSRSIRTWFMPALLAVLLVASATPALAQLSMVTASHDIFRLGGVGVNKYYAAYDSVNQVYMAVFDGTPARAVILNKQGTVILGPFGVTDTQESALCSPGCLAGFTRVDFGGPPDKPRFLLTYTVLEPPGPSANNPRRARLIDYHGGVPVIGPPITIANLPGGNWIDSDYAQSVWTGQQFIVGWSVPAGTALPVSFVAAMDINGNFTGAAAALGDGISDGIQKPAVACDAVSNVCLATGFGWDVPHYPNYKGDSWARMFNAQTLATTGTNVFYLDDQSGYMANQHVVFNKKTGQFQTSWERAMNYIDFRLVNTDGTMGPLDLTKSLGPHLGQIQLSYNGGTQTTLLAFKDNTDAWAVELNDQGYVSSIYSSMRITIPTLANTDGSGGDYYSATLYPIPAANEADAQWLVGYASMSRAGRAAVIAGAAAVPNVSRVSPASGPLAGGTVVTINGRGFKAGATVIFGATAATGVTFVSGSQIQATVPATVTPGAVAVTVTNPNATVLTLASAYTYFIPVTLTVTVVGNGTVTAGGITCPGTCSATLPIGTTVTLAPVPASGYVFAGWSGDADCLDGALSMAASTTCGARFILDRGADFNADGSADIVWRNRRTGAIVVWFMSGAGYVGYQSVPSALSTDWRIAAVGDFNRDERPDLLWRNSATGENQIWYNNGDGTFTAATVSTVADLDWKIVGAGDFNGDGKLDILWRNSLTGENIVWYMDGATELSADHLPAVVDSNWRIVAVADFNGDGNPDVVWRNTATGENLIWLMNGKAFIGSIRLNSVSDMNWAIACATDFNGDGKPDLLWRNQATGENIVWFMNNGIYVGYGRAPGIAGPDWDIMKPSEKACAGPSDVNCDGSPDIVWRNPATGANRVWYMNGESIVGSVALDSVPGTDWRIIGTADFNGDGTPDVFWRNIATGENIIWYMKGHAYAGYAEVPGVIDPAWQLVAIADVNGDGKPDLVWRNAVTGENLVWLMNGSTYTGYVRLPTVSDLNWTIAGAADFNGDGKPDLFWRNQSTGENVVWFMNGATYLSYASVPGIVNTNWQVVAIADYNGDGKPDLLWRNKTTGENLIWYMVGTSYLGYGIIPSETDTNWKIGPGLR